MAYASESRSTTQANIQDVFLNHARRERILLGFQLLDGRRFDARIKNFDRFAVIVELDGRDELVFKHAIASIASDRAVANYFAHHS
jgi:host factor-I protein